MPAIRLTLLIGQYAQDWHLGSQSHQSVTENVRHWQTFGPARIPLPHPSPRNNLWIKKHPWFEEQLLPELRQRVADSLR
jgi:uracil-DNA glycosylase